MSLATFAFFFLGICLNAVAQLLLKAGTNSIGEIHLRLDNVFAIGWKVATTWPIIGGMACYVISMGVWIVGLSRADVSLAYPLLSIGYILGTLGAWYFLGESISPMRIAAICVILFGVFLLTRS